MHFRAITRVSPIVAVGAATVLTLAGCGGSSTSSQSTVTFVQTETATSTQQSTTPALVTTPTTAAKLPEGHGVGASAFVGTWQRHESALTLNTDRTGSILIGASAMDVETWSLTWEPVGKGITITVGDQTQKSGAGLNGYLSHGQVLTGEFATGGSNTIMLQTHGTGTDDSETLSWCNQTYGSSPECGA